MLDAIEVPGRGVVVHVTDLPKRGLVAGILVHQGEHAWRVISVAHYRPPPPANELMLVMRAEPGCPAAPAPGPLEL